MLGVHKKELSAEAAIFAMQLQANWAEREYFCIVSIGQNCNGIPDVFVLSPSLTVGGHWSRVLPSLSALKEPLPSGCVPHMSVTVLAEKLGIFPVCWERVLLFRGSREVLAAACAIRRPGKNGSCSGTLELIACVKVSVLRCLKLSN